MNNTFNISRFALLLRRQWIENRMVYLASMMILFGFISFIYIIYIISEGIITSDLANVSAQKFYQLSRLDFRVFLLGLLGICYLSLLSGHFFSNMSKPAKAIQELTLPVSKAEKLFVTILFSSLFSIASFIVVFMMTDAIFVSTLKSMYKNVTMHMQPVSSPYENYGFKYIFQTFEPTELTLFAAFALLLTSVFCLGSLYFRRLAFVKTALTFTAFGILVLSVSNMIREQLTEGLIYVSDFRSYNDTVANYATFLFIISVGFLWTSTYFRLKEKEV